MEDLLEQLVGEIYDETDKTHPSGISKTDDGIEVEGGVELGMIKGYLSADLRGKYSESVSHWIINDIAKIPETNERFEIDGLTVIIQQSSGRHIHKVKILIPQKMNDGQHTRSNEAGTNAVSD